MTSFMQTVQLLKEKFSSLIFGLDIQLEDIGFLKELTLRLTQKRLLDWQVSLDQEKVQSLS